jgi:hypothetical protein
VWSVLTDRDLRCDRLCETLTLPPSGRITYLHVFGQGLVFLNTPEAVFELLDKRGAIYSDKPRLVMAGELCVCPFLITPLLVL